MRACTSSAANTLPPPSATPSTTSAQLLDAHSRWDWRAIVTELLFPWQRIEAKQLDTAVATCNDNGTMYCQRMQVIGGKLYLTDYRAIFFDRHYAPSRILPLLETLRRHPNLPGPPHAFDRFGRRLSRARVRPPWRFLSHARTHAPTRPRAHAPTRPGCHRPHAARWRLCKSIPSSARRVALATSVMCPPRSKANATLSAPLLR